MKFAHQKVLDNGPVYIVNNCNKIVLINTPTNDYATINTTAKVGEANLTSSNFNITGSSDRALNILINGISLGTSLAPIIVGSNAHLALLNTTLSEVLYVYPESTQSMISIGVDIVINNNSIYNFKQPT